LSDDSSRPSTDSVQDTVALELTEIVKRFGGTVALDRASLRVQKGTIHAVLGENGAGKTTLMRVAFGLIRPDAGSIVIDGRPQRLSSPAAAIAAGIGMVHQHFMLVPAMTVAENVALGGTGRYDANAVADRIREVGQQFRFAIDPRAIVATLSVADQQRVEILKALVKGARLLILDEPTAVLPPQDARALLMTLRAFVDNGGTVVLITHKLRDAIEFADDITVLRHGRTMRSAPAVELDETTLAATMIGTAPVVHTDFSTTSSTIGVEKFVLRDVSVTDDRGVVKLRNVNLTVHAGEIVGVAAVEGNGQHELLRVLANRAQPASGDVTRPDRVGFVPEDRHRDALILDFPIVENVALARAGETRGRMNWAEYRTTAERIVQEYDVRAEGVVTRARTLSGGNQQKLVMGREIETASGGLVVENPTRGLDIHATRAVHERLRQTKDQGTAVVVYSSDLDEVLALADRTVVLYGNALHTVTNDRESVGNAMVGRFA